MPLVVQATGPVKRAKAAPVPIGYTATHYVAPFASVSGASNDYADLGATSWTNAADSGTPTTLGTAMARATAGNQVQCAAGVYTGQAQATNWMPSFYPANSGTAGNEIVFFAATPAATNRGSPSSWSELRIDTPGSITSGDAVMGVSADYGGTHVIFDGFYANGTYVPAYSSHGAFIIGKPNVKFRRIYYDYGDDYIGMVTGQPSDNYVVFWVGTRSTTASEITDCYLTGNSGYGNHNYACITVGYATTNIVIRNNTFYDVQNGIFVKDDASDSGNATYGEISYNRFEACNLLSITIQHVQSGEALNIHHNLFLDGAIENDFSGFSASGRQTYNVYNNTFVGSAAGYVMQQDGSGSYESNPSFYNNVLADNASSVTAFWLANSLDFATNFADYSALDHNVYYDSNGAANFNDGTNRNFTSFKGELTSLPSGVQEANSLETTVTFVGGGDYRLASNGQGALTASDVGGPVGCYVTGSEEIGVRASPGY
jgi:hypothetical protein